MGKRGHPAKAKDDPLQRQLAHGGSVEVYSDGTVVVDGYTLPGGAPPADAFIDAYEQAALAVGHRYDDQMMNALVWADYACDLLAGQPVASHRCEQDFRWSVQKDFDAYEFGLLFPSYADDEISYREGERSWTPEELRLWADMEEATGVDRRERQKELYERGITHRPTGPKELPRSPLGAAGACVLGGTGLGTLLAIGQGLRSGGSLMKVVPRAGVSGCVTSAVVYSSGVMW